MFTKNFKGAFYFESNKPTGGVGEKEAKPKGGKYQDTAEKSTTTPEETKETTIEDTRTSLKDAQNILKDELTVEKKEEILKKGSNELVNLVESIFGKDTGLTTILKSVLSYFMPSVSAEGFIDWNKFSGIQGEAVEKAVISHRAGGYGEKPENSVAAIQEAVKNGETEIELDFRLNSEGEIVAAHDNTPESIAKGEKLDDLLKEMTQHKEVTYLMDLKGDASLVEALSAKINGLEDSEGFKKQLVFTAFNPVALQKATELFPEQQIFFHYFPKGKMPFLDIAQNLLKSDIPMVKEKLHGLLTSIDKQTGSNYAAQIDTILLLSNEKAPFKTTAEKKEIIHIYNVLPPESVLAMLKKSGGALSVPWPMVSEWPEFFKKAKDADVKIAVFGFGKAIGEEGKKAHDANLQKAIAMGANYIITDHPNVM